jgi:hypothetical protein
MRSKSLNSEESSRTGSPTRTDVQPSSTATSPSASPMVRRASQALGGDPRRRPSLEPPSLASSTLSIPSSSQRPSYDSPTQAGSLRASSLDVSTVASPSPRRSAYDSPVYAGSMTNLSASSSKRPSLYEVSFHMLSDVFIHDRHLQIERIFFVVDNFLIAWIFVVTVMFIQV